MGISDAVTLVPIRGTLGPPSSHEALSWLSTPSSQQVSGQVETSCTSGPTWVHRSGETSQSVRLCPPPSKTMSLWFLGFVFSRLLREVGPHTLFSLSLAFGLLPCQLIPLDSLMESRQHRRKRLPVLSSMCSVAWGGCGSSPLPTFLPESLVSITLNPLHVLVWSISGQTWWKLSPSCARLLCLVSGWSLSSVSSLPFGFILLNFPLALTHPSRLVFLWEVYLLSPRSLLTSLAGTLPCGSPKAPQAQCFC